MTDLDNVFFWTHMPYCLHRLKDGYWILLNRNYKPIGTGGYKHVDYEKSETKFKFKRVPKKFLLHNFILLPHCRDEKGEYDMYFFYNDASKPFRTRDATAEYFHKLKVFAEFMIFPVVK
jgi:hypothetical protein